MSFAVFLAALCFAPLAFGTTEAWSTAALELLVVLTGLCWFSRRKVCYQVPGLVPLLLFLSWMCLQCIPLPVTVAEHISPHTAEIYQPVLDLLPPDTWIPLTVSRQASLLEVLRLNAYALFYVLTVQLCSSSRRLARTVTVVAVLAIVLAFVSSLQRATAPGTLFWFRELQSGYGSFGPWVYKNQYAGFMVMTWPAVLALFLLHRSAGWEGESFREKFITLFTGPGAASHLFFGFGSLVVLSSIFFSQSRGGVISITFTALLFFLLLIRSQGKIQTLTLLLLALCLFLVSSLGWFSWDTVLEGFRKTVDAETGRLTDSRLPLWEDTIRIIADFPAAGAGFGSFLDIFPSYKSFADNLIYDHAHNDFLELLTDGGIPGFLLAAWFVAVILKTGLRQIVIRQDRSAVLPSIAAFSGIGGLLVFSVTDFNLHNGANGLYFFFLCGLLTAAGHVRQPHHHRPTLLEPAAQPGLARLAGFACAAALLVAVLRIHGGSFLADALHRRAHLVSASMQRPEKKTARINTLLEKAWQSSPCNSLYPYLLANLRRYQNRDDQALNLYLEAALLQPLAGAHLQDIGLLLADGDMEQARAFIEEGYRRALEKEGPLKTWAEFELSRGSRKRAAQVLRTALEGNADLLKTAYPVMTKYNFTQEEIAAVLPETASAWMQWWFLARADSRGAASSFFMEHALDYLDGELKIKPELFLYVSSYYWQQRREERAIGALQEGIRRLPDHALFRLYLGDHYWRKGLLPQALEEYEQARRIEPGNAGIQERIAKVRKEQQR